MYKDKLAAYVKIQRTTGSPREIEAEALTVGANKLRYCRDNWNTPERKEMLNSALRFNQRLWSIFQASLESNDNPLPKDIRLNLLRLSAFVDKQIFTIMAYPSPEKLTSIIDINLGIAEGLRKKPASSPEVICKETEFESPITGDRGSQKRSLQKFT